MIYKLQYDSYAQFINEIIFKTLIENENIIYVSEDKETNIIYEYSFKYENINLKYPEDDNGKIIYPEDARRYHLSYSSKLYADVKQIQKIRNMNLNTVEEKIVGFENNVLITKIPVMVRSLLCSTTIKSININNECDYDPGCHFIIKGSEKVIMAMERMCENKILIFTGKDDILYKLTVNSKQHDINANIQKADLFIYKDGTININTKQFGEIPICIFFKALGVQSDEQIINYIIYDKSDLDIINIFRKSLLITSNEIIKLVNENGLEYNLKIISQDDAIKYLSYKIRDYRRFLISKSLSQEMQDFQKQQMVINILQNDFLPHMGTNLLKKIYYLGLMVNKILMCYLERQKPDDRDNYINKRIDLPGILMAKLFKDYYKKMILEISKIFKKRFNGDNIKPIVVINSIKATTIEQGLNQALATGVWGSPKKKGVAQVLQRLSYLFTVSCLRRISIAPILNDSNNKVDKMRHVNNIQLGYIDSAETPDGGSIGLIKNLSLTCGITLHLTSQVQIVCHIIKNSKTKFVDLLECKNQELKYGNRVFINGEWLGVSYEPNLLVDYLKENRRIGSIDNTVSIIFDVFNRNIKINCDGGRMYRPLLKVRNNKIVLTQEMLDEIDLDEKSQDDIQKISNWNQFIYKHNDCIEYIDIEETEQAMIAMYTTDVDREYLKMNTIIKNPNINGSVINRYDNTVYVKYTHCELHPMLMLGIITSNIPFCNHNQSPRNYYNFALSRQGMGIYSTNYRERIDLSYIIYNPQIPLVRTLNSKYTNVMHMPCGVNVIVAIMCYTGMNQEDSIIINKSSLDRGLFRATIYKKYESELKKNSTTTQDDEFLKPDKKITANIKDSNYEKLNQKGYVPEETTIENGDVLIGKVSPIQGDSEKKYIDQSEIYKSNVNGIIDRVYDIQNAEEHKMYNIKVRSERYSMIGDKYCKLSSSQVLTNKGWINFDNLYKRVKLENEEILIAQLKDNKYIEYVKPIDVYKFDYNGPMYKLRSQFVDLDTTIDHKMYVQKRKTHYVNGVKKYGYSGEYEQMAAKDVFGKRLKYKKNCENLNKDIEFLELNETKYEYDAFLELLGIFISDGCISKEKSCINITCGKERKILHLQDFCKRLNVDLYSSKNENTQLNTMKLGMDHNIKSKDLTNYLRDLSVGAINKYLPEYVWNLSQRQSRVLLESLISGDGSYNKQGSCGYYTSSKQLADDVMRLAIHAGWSGQIILVRPEGVEYSITGEDGRTSEGYTNADALCVRINKTKNEPEINHGHTKQQNGQTEEIYDYEGEVYCLQVPEHVFMVRQNNKNVWTGNCCYDDQTDVLTNNGWIPINELQLTDKVATLQNGTTLEYHNPTALQQYDYKGDMYQIKSNQIDLFVTPEHNMYVGNRDGYNFQTKQAKTLYGKRCTYLKNAEKFNNIGLEYFVIPGIKKYDENIHQTKYRPLFKNTNNENKHQMLNHLLMIKENDTIQINKYKKLIDDIDMGDEIVIPLVDKSAKNKKINRKIYKNDLVLDVDAWLIFYGIWLAEGCNNQTRVEFAANKQRVKDALKEACDILGFQLHIHLSEGQYNKYCVYDKRVVKYLKDFSVKAIYKTMPHWVWDLNRHQCRVLIYGMMLGDGHTTYEKIGGCRHYDTSSTKLAGDFQRLCLHAGWSCNKKLKYPAGHSTVMKTVRPGYVITSNVDSWRLTIITKQNRPKVNKNIKPNGNDRHDNWVPFEGKVYCCTVPGSILYVRRGGYVCWSKNSVNGQKGTIGLILDSADMPFTESGIQPDIIINPNCFVGSSLIQMSNGLSRRIDSFSQQGLESVLTFKKKGLINSFSLGMECKGIQKTLKITLMDGRELICTPEHKFKVKFQFRKDLQKPELGYRTEYIYKEARELLTMDNKYADTLITSIEYPEDNMNEDKNCDWELNMGEFKFNMKTYNEREKSLAFARLLGFILTDGTIHKVKDQNEQYAVRLSISHMIDVNQILDDIYLLINKKPQITGDEYVYVVSLPNKLGKEIANLEGIVNGRRTTQESSLPTFLFDNMCPKSFIREFLGGYFGGDGHSPFIKYNNFETVKLSQSTCQEFEESLVDKMNNIIYLLDKVGVKSKIQRIRDCHKNNQTYIDRPRIQVEISIDSNINFMNQIGFRYCCDKSARLSIAVSYERYGNYVKKQHNEMIQLINQKINNQKKININVAIEESRSEYFKYNKPLNEYYSLLNKTQVDNRRRKDRSNTLDHFDYKFIENPQEYLKLIGCYNYFGKDINGKKQYIVGRNINYIPTWNMKILQIEEHSEELVYDIGVAKYNNFITSGICVSNCIPSRMTIAQLLESLVGKAGALNGTPMDGTPFNNYDIETIYKILEDNGFDKTGDETMYCGLTGKKMNSKIFIGVNYYIRLKHLVQEKIHARARGQQQMLTRQAPEGRAKDGGLRLGEMEKDSLIGHGAAYFLKEKLLDSSDKYEMWVCNECGKIAQKQIDKEIYICKDCKNTETSKIVLPYSMKLLIQELMSINILPQLLPENQN